MPDPRYPAVHEGDGMVVPMKEYDWFLLQRVLRAHRPSAEALRRHSGAGGTGSRLQDKQHSVHKLRDFAQTKQRHPVIVELNVTPAVDFIRGLRFCKGEFARHLHSTPPGFKTPCAMLLATNARAT